MRKLNPNEKDLCGSHLAKIPEKYRWQINHKNVSCNTADLNR